MSVIAFVPATVPPRGRVYDWSLALLVLLMLAISPAALEAMGWQYGEAGGNALEKIHPATVLAVLVLLAAASTRANPVTSITAALERYPGLIVYIAGIVLLVADAIYVVGIPFTTFIDTFLTPAIVFLLLVHLPEARGQTLARLIHAFFIVNALVGIAEFAFGFRITPLVAEGVSLEEEWRSSALLGHPLANAILTGTYMVILAFGGGRDLPSPLRPVAFLICAAGMIVFGGRAASALLVLFLLVALVGRSGRILSGARFSLNAVLAALILVPLAALALMVLYDGGFFDQFLGRFVDDDGSASTRIVMFELFKHVSWPDLLFGPDHGQIVTLMSLYGLDFGIECFWLSMIFAHGLIVSCAFFVALYFFCREVIRAAGPGGLTAFLYFFAVASTSLSLSAKSLLFATLVLMVMVLLRPLPKGRVGARA